MGFKTGKASYLY